MKKITLNLLVFIIALSIFPNLAAPAEPEAARARIWGDAIMNADVGDGGYSVNQAGASLRWRMFSLSYTRSHYSWSNPGRLPFNNSNRDPWDTLQSLNFDVNFDGDFKLLSEGRQLRWFAGGNIYSSWESDLSNSFGLGGRLGLAYSLNSNWSFRLGGFLRYHPTGVDGFPLLGLSWQQDGAERQGWSLALGSPSTMVQYRFNPWLALSLGASYHYGVHRLADDSPVYSAGYVRSRHLVAGIYANVTPVERLNLSLGLEGNFWRELRLYNDDGDDLDSYEVDNALGLVFSFSYGF
jgi:hypothetical protein